MKVLCSRCGAVVAHLNALLGHYQEVHGGVPKPRFVVESSGQQCDNDRADTVRKWSVPVAPTRLITRPPGSSGGVSYRHGREAS